MNRSQLIEILAQKQPHLARQDVKLTVKIMLKHLSETLASGERIEIRAFGSFTLHHLLARTGRNPKTGELSHPQLLSDTSLTSSQGRSCGSESTFLIARMAE